jgi:hypothetical protein
MVVMAVMSRSGSEEGRRWPDEHNLKLLGGRVLSPYVRTSQSTPRRRCNYACVSLRESE